MRAVPSNDKRGIKYLSEWRREDREEESYKPLTFTRDELFKSARESDLKDRRKVIGVLVSRTPGEKGNGDTYVHYGVEDMVRARYSERAEFYFYRGALRIKKDGVRGYGMEFHRLDNLREEFVCKIGIDTYLKSVFEDNMLIADRRIVLEGRE